MIGKSGLVIKRSMMLIVLATLQTQPMFAQMPATMSLTDFVERRLFDSICDTRANPLAKRVFTEYGAVFAAENVRLPDKCVFANEAEVQRFQQSLTTKNAVIRGTRIELQKAAMESLLEVVSEASLKELAITPLDGSIAGRRSYTDTVRIWNSRFLPALKFWIDSGKLATSEADEVRAMNIPQQVLRVTEWEGKGMFFSTNFTRSIFTSTAPPGTSQHLSLLALDIQEHDNSEVREIFYRHGWYQTVKDDATHFTYLGVPEAELPARGLKLVADGQFRFWLPNVE